MADETAALREAWLQKLTRYEAGLYGLIKEIRAFLPFISRDEAKAAGARVELASGAIEDMIRAREEDDGERAIRSIQSASEQMLLMKADLERREREIERAEEELDLETAQRRAKLKRMREELSGTDDGSGVEA